MFLHSRAHDLAEKLTPEKKQQQQKRVIYELLVQGARNEQLRHEC